MESSKNFYGLDILTEICQDFLKLQRNKIFSDSVRQGATPVYPLMICAADKDNAN